MKQAMRGRLLPEVRTVIRETDPVLPAVLVMTMALFAVAVALAILPLALTMGDLARGVERRLDLAGSSFSRVPGFPEKSTIYARDGSVLSSLYLDEDREIVAFEDIAPIARQAILAIEDDKFYEHGALDVPGLFRAVIENLAAGEITQGGSTITQQLVKRAVIGDDRQTFARKFQEAALAIRVEERYTKDEILTLYLNEVFFGNGTYGIGTASRFYFDVEPADLSLEQAALLAALIKAPSTYDPVKNPEAARERRNLVLERLGDLGWVDDAEIERAQASPIELRRGAGKKRRQVQPFFAFYITRSILDMDDHTFDVFGRTYDQRVHTLYQGGLSIYTTLDPAWQRDAQAAVDASPAISPEEGVGPDVSLVSIDTESGGIRTMLSGKNYLRDKLDLAWRGRRQVGSAFKAITLTAALEAGVPPSKTYDSTSPYCDVRWKSEDGCVRNAEGEGEGGPMDLWRATQLSVNVVYAQLALDIGPERIVDVAHRLGITADLDAVPSITLGVEEVSTLEMAAAYATLANDGIHCETYAIDRILLPDGSPIFEHSPRCTQAVEPEVAHQVTAMLQRVVSGGTGWRANIGRPVAGKTGTGQDYTNVYFAGYTPQVATAVWIGFPEGNVPMDSYFGESVFGGTLAAPIWHDFMLSAMAGLPVESFPAATGMGGSRSVPDVVGMSISEARAALLAFSPVFVVQSSPGAALNVILGQEPAPGTVLASGAPITLRVAEGSDVEIGGVVVGSGMPDLVGSSILSAIEVLHAYDLSIRIIYPQDQQIAGQTWYVSKQSPEPGSAVPTSGEVTLWATLAAPTPSPTPVTSSSPTPSPGGCGLGC